MRNLYFNLTAIALMTYSNFCEAARPSASDIYGYDANGGSGFGSFFDYTSIILILIAIGILVVIHDHTKGFLKGLFHCFMMMILPGFVFLKIFMALEPSIGKIPAVIFAAGLYYLWIKFYKSSCLEK